MIESQTLSEKAEAAFKQAARKVVERARQTGTPILLWEDGRIKEVSIEQIERIKEFEGLK